MANDKKENKEMLGLDISSIIRDVCKDWWMVVTAGIVAMMCAYMLVHITYVPTYTSSATFMVSARKSTMAVISDISMANSMADTLGKVMNSDILKKTVQEDLGLDSFPATITAAAVPETNLMTLRVAADSPEMSFRVICSIIDKYTEITDHVMDNVVLDVLEHPSVPSSPSNPKNVNKAMKIALVLGVGGMAFMLAVLSYLKDTVKNERELPIKLDTKLLVTVKHESKYKTLRKNLQAMIKGHKRSVLVTDPTVSMPFVEAFKKLRAKLVHQPDQDGCKVIVVASVAENEGKSTVAVNIALALAQKSDRVVLVDGDLRRPAVHKILEQDLRPKQEIGFYIKGKSHFDNMLVYDKRTGLYTVGGTRQLSNSTELVSSERTVELIDRLRERMEYVVIDTPPTSIMADAEVWAEMADYSVLVVKQNMTDTSDINDAIDMLEGSQSTLLGCVYNDVRPGVFDSLTMAAEGYGKYAYGRYSYGRYGRYGRYMSKADENA